MNTGYSYNKIIRKINCQFCYLLAKPLGHRMSNAVINQETYFEYSNVSLVVFFIKCL